MNATTQEDHDPSSDLPPVSRDLFTSTPAMPHVKLRAFAAGSGYSENALRLKIKRGVWRRGHEFHIAPDGNVLVDLEGYDRWVRGEPT
jgi:hypothetical protein